MNNFNLRCDDFVFFRLVHLSHHFGRKIASFLFNALPDNKQGKAIHFRRFRRKQFLHSLIRILDEGLTKQRHFSKIFGDTPVNHPGHDIGRLTAFLRLGGIDQPFTLQQLGRHLIAWHANRFAGCDMHGQILAKRLVAPGVIDHYADFCPMQI